MDGAEGYHIAQVELVETSTFLQPARSRPARVAASRRAAAALLGCGVRRAACGCFGRSFVGIHDVVEQIFPSIEARARSDSICLSLSLSPSLLFNLKEL